MTDIARRVGSENSPEGALDSQKENLMSCLSLGRHNHFFAFIFFSHDNLVRKIAC